MVTLAPELPGANWICSVLAERGILIAAGHSMASYQEAKTGINAGVRYGTHIFNAMPPFHQREPGLVGAILADERVTVGLIADGLHVHPGIIKAIWQIAGDGRLNLVTDAIAALGMPDGVYQLGKLTVNVDGKSCRLPDGTLAGSTLSLDTGLKNLMKYTGCSLPEALRTITATPAALLGLGRQKGQIAIGYDADLVLLDPDYTVDKTIVDGKVLYAK
jgi:N-acetylglucosamine-6-phosphate deacetylase